MAEKVYVARLRDAFTHVGREAMTNEDFLLLRYGRQFRLSDRVKVIVGRNEQENGILAKSVTARISIEPIGAVGPLTLIEGTLTPDEVLLCARLAARYCDHNGIATLAMRVILPGEERVVEVAPLAGDDPRLSEWRIGGD